MWRQCCRHIRPPYEFAAAWPCSSAALNLYQRHSCNLLHTNSLARHTTVLLYALLCCWGVLFIVWHIDSTVVQVTACSTARCSLPYSEQLRLAAAVLCRGEEGVSCFEYLMAHGARYNQQSLEELGAAAAAGQDD
jgi:hypothetical protein